MTVAGGEEHGRPYGIKPWPGSTAPAFGAASEYPGVASAQGAPSMTRTSRRKFQARCECLEGRQLLSGTYIINAYSGKVIEDPGFSTANGQDVRSISSPAAATSSGTSSRFPTATLN
jgi:hypothetical protein